MSNVCERLSGAKYKKLAKEKLDREKKVLSKVLNLDSFFLSNSVALNSRSEQHFKNPNTAREDNLKTCPAEPSSNGNIFLLTFFLNILKATFF